jgi:hypothetical protein
MAPNSFFAAAPNGYVGHSFRTGQRRRPIFRERLVGGQQIFAGCVERTASYRGWWVSRTMRMGGILPALLFLLARKNLTDSLVETVPIQFSPDTAVSSVSSGGHQAIVSTGR